MDIYWVKVTTVVIFFALLVWFARKSIEFPDNNNNNGAHSTLVDCGPVTRIYYGLWTLAFLIETNEGMRVNSVSRRYFFFILVIGGFVIFAFTYMRSKDPVTISSIQELIASSSLNRVTTQIAQTNINEATTDKDEYKTVDTLLFFVGYPRSRHTLMASLLDAHPHMIVANEKNLFYRLRNGGKYERNKMFDILIEGSKGFLRGGKGIVMEGNLQNTTHFGFWMEGYWQGSYDKYIKVIGDKTAWITSGVFRSTSPEELTKLVDDMEKTYRVKVKFIHMMRNPFDIVSTITLRNTKHEGGRFGDHSKKVDDPELLEQSMERFFNWALGSAVAREVLGDKLLDVDGLELVNKPVEYMTKVCGFIEITCSDDYLRACAKVVDSTPSTTREWVVWSKEHMNRMYSEFEKYPFLAHYTFDD